MQGLTDRRYLPAHTYALHQSPRSFIRGEGTSRDSAQCKIIEADTDERLDRFRRKTLPTELWVERPPKLGLHTMRLCSHLSLGPPIANAQHKIADDPPLMLDNEVVPILLRVHVCPVIMIGRRPTKPPADIGQPAMIPESLGVFEFGWSQNETLRTTRPGEVTKIWAGARSVIHQDSLTRAVCCAPVRWLQTLGEHREAVDRSLQ